MNNETLFPRGGESTLSCPPFLRLPTTMENQSAPSKIQSHCSPVIDLKAFQMVTSFFQTEVIGSCEDKL